LRIVSLIEHAIVVRGLADTVHAKTTNIADHIHRLADQILDRWREEVRRDPEQFALVHHLDDQELQDHLPALIAKIINLLRGEPADNLEEDAAEHGRQRRALGYSVVPLLHEMQIFRHMLLSMVEEIVGAAVSVGEIEQARNLIINIVDRSMNVSIAQYTLAAEEERNSAQNEARELHEQRDRFLVTLSHELRNQVSPILLGLQLLKDLKPADHRMHAAVARIERQARQQAILIDDLLDMSRFRYGKLQLKRENLDLRVPVQHALETFQGDFAAKQLKLEIQLPTQPLVAFADETRIAQVLINLLSNALKFTPAGGTISVELAQEDGAAIVTVRDTGIGINPAILPQLFTMFFQVDTPSKAVKAGLGIGLSLAKILVELHGGTMEAHSEGEGKGAEFTVRLPITEETCAAQPLSPARRILVVDDNPDQLELLAELLRLRGYEVIVAHDATEALRLVAEHSPRACVIDIGLPDIDGYELARRLRTLPETRDARLIAVTGFGTLADQETFEKAGFDHYFPKPPDLDKFMQALTS
jgi:signal transduction histidine kinase